MQVSLDTTGPLGRKLHVSVPETDVATAVQSRLANISRTAQMDGFRKGKVPLKLVERRYGGQVRQEVVGELLRQNFAVACQQHNLRPAGEPSIESLSADPGEGLRFTAEFEVYPELTLSDFTALSVRRLACEITEPDLDTMLETLRQQRAEWVDVERPAQIGDRLVIDFSGTMEGTAFDGGSASDFNLELGKPGFIPGFAEGMVGLAAGQATTLALQFPDGYHRADLAGKPAAFAITVKAVKEPRLPEVDASFFAAFEVYDGGMEAFRRELRQNMERERDQLLRERVKRSAFDALMAANEFTVPQSLVVVECRRMLDELRQNVAMRGMDPAQLPDVDPVATFSSRAHDRVKLALIISEIVRSHGLRPDPARVRELIERTAASYQDPQAVVRWFYEDRSRLADIEAAALEEGVVEWLLGRAQVEQVAITFDELRQSGQTPSGDSQG